MRKRRKTRYQWLESLGTVGPGSGDQADAWNGRDFGAHSVDQNGATTLTILPLLADEPTDDAVAPVIIPTMLQQDYFIKRIVGKVFINHTQDNSINDGAVISSFGIFVARCGDENASAGNNTKPVGCEVLAVPFTPTSAGLAAQLGGVLNYSPLALDAIRQPWIWRRVWITSNKNTQSVAAISSFPANNVEYGSIQDGPHVDAKTARRVRDDERLFGVFATKIYPFNITQGDPPTVRCTFDFRVLGAPRRHRQKSSF